MHQSTFVVLKNFLTKIFNNTTRKLFAEKSSQVVKITVPLVYILIEYKA
jgi:hypothetical protein